VPTRLVELAVDAADPARLARFWAAALGWQVVVEEPDEAEIEPPGYDHPDPVALPLVFVKVPDGKRVKNRMHLDVAPYRDEDQAAAVAALREAGAVPVDVGQRDVSWVVLADPEGSEFCVLSPR
jgi:glyoxalase superfamily protein